MLNSQWLTSQIYFLTVYNYPHIQEETIDDLKSLRCRHPGLVLGQSVQPPKDSLDIILSEKFLSKFLCTALSQEIRQQRRTHSVVLALSVLSRSRGWQVAPPLSSRLPQ